MKVGIIGAGTMGSGIAQAFAQTEGYEVCCKRQEKNRKRIREKNRKRQNGSGQS